MPDPKRLEREIRQCLADKESHISVQRVEDNLFHLKGSFPGPSETPYEGGIFVIDIKIPDEYPFQPPKMKFDTKIYHPNISSQTGAICLDILKDTWTPVFTLKSTLISIQSLLCEAVPDDPQDAEVAKVYLREPKRFEETARKWTRLYATQHGDMDDFDDDVDKEAFKRLCEMGFDRSATAKALRKAEGNEQRAIDFLLSGAV